MAEYKAQASFTNEVALSKIEKKREWRREIKENLEDKKEKSGTQTTGI